MVGFADDALAGREARHHTGELSADGPRGALHLERALAVHSAGQGRHVGRYGCRCSTSGARSHSALNRTRPPC